MFLRNLILYKQNLNLTYFFFHIITSKMINKMSKNMIKALAQIFGIMNVVKYSFSYSNFKLVELSSFFEISSTRSVLYTLRIF